MCGTYELPWISDSNKGYSPCSWINNHLLHREPMNRCLFVVRLFRMFYIHADTPVALAYWRSQKACFVLCLLGVSSYVSVRRFCFSLLDFHFPPSKLAGTDIRVQCILQNLPLCAAVYNVTETWVSYRFGTDSLSMGNTALKLEPHTHTYAASHRTRTGRSLVV